MFASGPWAITTCAQSMQDGVYWSHIAPTSARGGRMQPVKASRPSELRMWIGALILKASSRQPRPFVRRALMSLRQVCAGRLCHGTTCHSEVTAPLPSVCVLVPAVPIRWKKNTISHMLFLVLPRLEPLMHRSAPALPPLPLLPPRHLHLTLTQMIY